jgi:putative hydrolase of the HAD superfamily
VDPKAETRPGMLTLFKAVLFDLDDTLHDDTVSYRYAAERAARDIAVVYGLDAYAIACAYELEATTFWESLHASDLAKRPVGLLQRFWGLALRKMGIEDEALATRAAEAFNRYRMECVELFPGALELLLSLRERGLALGLVTNGFVETHREKIELLRLEEIFHVIAIADEVGMIKPDPRIFAHVCERLGVLPSASVMIGDNFERDILGARAAGMQTVWFNERNEEIPPGAVPPDAIAQNIDALAGLLNTAPHT